MRDIEKINHITNLIEDNPGLLPIEFFMTLALEYLSYIVNHIRLYVNDMIQYTTAPLHIVKTDWFYIKTDEMIL